MSTVSLPELRPGALIDMLTALTAPSTERTTT